MRSFLYEARPGRVLFGAGTRAALPQEAERLGITRPLVLATAAQRDTAEAIAALLPPTAAIHDCARMHTPVDVTAVALDVALRHFADGLVAVGGGSTTGLGKAIALRSGLPQIVLPTTYAGSEMTPILGETENGLKTTITDPKVLPQVVIYDVELTMGLPPRMSAVSGLNAMAHAVEALYARNANPVTTLMAREAIGALGRALPAIVASPADPQARGEALYGAWLCGICLGTVGMALHHKLCHTLGGTFDLPHAETHAIVLPHAVAYNAAATPEAMADIAAALGVPLAHEGLFNLLRRTGAPTALCALGMPEEGIARAADLAVANPYWNPRPLERAPIEALLRRAFAGEPPRPA